VGCESGERKAVHYKQPSPTSEIDERRFVLSRRAAQPRHVTNSSGGTGTEEQHTDCRTNCVVYLTLIQATRGKLMQHNSRIM